MLPDSRSIKFFLKRHMPIVLATLRVVKKSYSNYRHRKVFDRLLPHAQHFVQTNGWTVKDGPFRGMRYHEGSLRQLPRLIGSYEAEIHAFVENALSRKPAVIIDIGCEAGYIAVGLAMRSNTTQVHAFDIDEGAQAKCRALAALNGVTDRVHVAGECTPQLLEELCIPNALVFCDCEGCEFDILDPKKVLNLSRSNIIVELHDHVRLDVTISESLLSRFSATHDIKIASRARRKPMDFPSVQCLPESVRELAMYEDRMPNQQWAYLTPLAK